MAESGQVKVPMVAGPEASTLCCAFGSPFDIAARAGIDLGLIEDNLRLSHEHRALQHQDALDLALEIERAGKRLRERSATSAAHAR